MASYYDLFDRLLLYLVNFGQIWKFSLTIFPDFSPIFAIIEKIKFYQR